MNFSVQDISECVSICLGHSLDVRLNRFEEITYRQVMCCVFHLFSGFEPIAAMFFVFQVWEDSIEYLEVGSPLEESVCNIRRNTDVFLHMCPFWLRPQETNYGKVIGFTRASTKFLRQTDLQTFKHLSGDLGRGAIRS